MSPKSDVLVGAGQTVLELDNVIKDFGRSDVGGRSQRIRAVDGVSLGIGAGETFGLVGESGSGKSTLAKLLLLLEYPSRGTVSFHGSDITKLKRRELRQFRRRVQAVFQDPVASLNRRKTVAESIALPLRAHCPDMDKGARMERVAELLELVGLRSEHAKAYPRELSGGQCQRVSIARALAVRPEVVVLDEPVSAIDVSIQAQILNLLKGLQAELGMTYVFISHDLSVVRYMSTRIGVMYRGRIVELAPREALFRSPRHPYTRELMMAIPRPESSRIPLVLSPVTPTDNEGIVPGTCRYRSRCALGRDEPCLRTEPSLEMVEADHYVACHFSQTYS